MNILRSPFCLCVVVLVAAGSIACEKKKPEAEVDRHAKKAVSQVKALPQSEYVGRDTCGPCHEEQVSAHIGGHHDETLGSPNSEGVRAPFAGEQLKGRNLAAAFTRKDGVAMIVSGRDMPLHWTIGADPVQQYIVEGKRGRYQVFGAAYDSRESWKGGKRWFFPEGGDVPAGADSHYLAPSATWNSECASCHSTNAEKKYDRKTDSYDTSFSEQDVSCEACHGPASRHVELAKKPEVEWGAEKLTKGLTRQFVANTDRRFYRSSDEDTARFMPTEGVPAESDEVQACNACHSLREDLGPASSEDFDDRFELTLLTKEHFHPGGARKGTTYTGASFLQSKKAVSGVICSDCHNPHSSVLRKPAERLCFDCHSESAFSSEKHHFHPVGAEGGPECVDCHMPERNSLSVDGRRDHRFAIPQPGLSELTGEPNACVACHAEKSHKWAGAALAEAHPAEADLSTGLAFHAARQQRTGAGLLLSAVFDEESLGELVRASALAEWARLDELEQGARFERAVTTAAQDKKALMRISAARAAPRLKGDKALSLLRVMWADPKRSVRLASLEESLLLELSPGDRKSSALKSTLVEIKASAEYRSDSLTGLILLGDIAQFEERTDEALALYLSATEKYSRAALAYERAIGLLNNSGKEAQALELATGASSLYPEHAEFFRFRAMALVRAKKFAQAQGLLKQAYENATAEHRRQAGYAYAITVNETGDWAEAIAILRELRNYYPKAGEIQPAIDLIQEKRGQK